MEMGEKIGRPEPKGLEELRSQLVVAPFGGVEHQAFNDFLDRTGAEYEASEGFSIHPTATKLSRDTVRETGKSKLTALQLQVSQKMATIIGYRHAFNDALNAFQAAKSDLPPMYDPDQSLLESLRGFQETLGTDEADNFDFFRPSFLWKPATRYNFVDGYRFDYHIYDYRFDKEMGDGYVKTLVHEGIVTPARKFPEHIGNTDIHSTNPNIGRMGYSFQLENSGIGLREVAPWQLFLAGDVSINTAKFKIAVPLDSEGDLVVFVIKDAKGRLIPHVAPLSPRDYDNEETPLKYSPEYQVRLEDTIYMPLQAFGVEKATENLFLLQGIRNTLDSNYPGFGRKSCFDDFLEKNPNKRIQLISADVQRSRVHG